MLRRQGELGLVHMRVLAIMVGSVLGCVLGGAVAVAQSVEAPLPAPAPLPSSSADLLSQPSAPKPQSYSAVPLPTTVAAPVAQPAPLLAAPASAPVVKKKPAPPPLETALSTDPSPTFQPDTLAATQRAAEHYADIVKTGGWATDTVELRGHSIGPEVTKLRKRLSIEGDLPSDQPIEGPAAQIWDGALTTAVKHFQSRMGLRETGIVAGETLKQINVPAEARAAALAASVERMSAFNFGFGDRYVVVNLPSTSVEAVENGQVAHRYVAIVGDPDHASPQIAAHITQVTLNPTWTLPVSIIKKEIIPRMQRDPGYLTRQKIRILDASGAEVDPKSIDWTTNRAVNYTLRQDSGAGNSLGSIRINMPNKLAVYMHDTPGKRLFGADYRFLSHGCVRVQGVFDYAEWLLQGSSNPDGGVWDKAAMQAKVKDGARLDIEVKKPVGVIWLYLTGWANDDGLVHFRDDVYGLDNPAVAGSPKAGAVASATIQVAPLSPLRRSRVQVISTRPLPNRVESIRRALFFARTRRTDGQSRRPIPPQRPNARSDALEEPRLDRLRLRIQGQMARRLGSGLHSPVLSRRADRVRRRPSALLRVPSQGRIASMRGARRRPAGRRDRPAPARTAAGRAPQAQPQAKVGEPAGRRLRCAGRVRFRGFRRRPPALEFCGLWPSQSSTRRRSGGFDAAPACFRARGRVSGPLRPQGGLNRQAKADLLGATGSPHGETLCQN